MNPSSVDVDRGIAWFSCGWRIFAGNPGVWILQTLVLVVGAVVLTVIPFGSLVLTFFMPTLAAGLLFGAAELHSGRTLTFGHLFQGFRDKAKFNHLMALGGVSVGATLLSLVVSLGFMGSAMMMGGAADPDAMMRLGPNLMIALLLVLTIQLTVTALIYFAVPLVTFHDISAGAAMQSSLRACLRNVLPLFVFSLVYLVLAIIASLPLGLGWLVLIPWSVGMIYCSYKDIFQV